MFSNPFFDDRADAGEKLAEAVADELGKLNLTAREAVKPIVYALPRGGLPIAVPVARRLGCALDVVVAKKITRPDNLELAIGAATADGHVLWQKQKQQNLRLQKSALQQAQNSAQSLFDGGFGDFGGRWHCDGDDGGGGGAGFAIPATSGFVDLRARRPARVDGIFGPNRR
jgi:hypothetical protein